MPKWTNRYACKVTQFMLNRLLITLFYKLYGGRSTRLMATVVHLVPRPSYALYDGRHTTRTANVVSCVSRPPYNHHFVENKVGIWWQISPISIWWVIVLIGIKCAFLSCLSALHRFNSAFFIVEYRKTSFRKLIFCKKDEAYIENRIFICNFAHLNIYVIFECFYDHEENYSGCPSWCFAV